MTAATRMRRPVQRNSPHRLKPTGHSLNVEPQCERHENASVTGPMETEWITEGLIARTQDVWGRYLERDVDREEAIEIVLNIQRIALAFYQAATEGEDSE